MAPKHTRKPGWLEKYYIIRNTHGFYTNFNITVRLNRHFGHSHLGSAIRELLKSNLWYCLNFFRDPKYGIGYFNGNDYHVSYVDKIMLEDVVSYRSVDAFDPSFLSEINDIVLPMNSLLLPLWRLIVFEQPDGAQYLCGVFDHSMFDGGSGLMFLEQLVHHLSVSRDIEPKTLFQYDTSLPPVPVARQSVTNLYTPSISQVLSWYFHKFAPSLLLKWASKLVSWWNKNKEKPLVYPVYSNPTHNWEENNLKTSITNINFTPLQISRILRYCRHHNITITPFFNVTMLQCLDKTLFKSDSTKYSTTSYIAFQGRRYFPKLAQDLLTGVWVSALGITLPPITNPLETTKYVYGEMQKNLASRKTFKTWGMNRFFNYRQFFLGNPDSPKISLTVSNLGRVNASDDRFAIVDAYFGSCVGTNYNVILNIISTAEGGLNATIGYFPGFDDIYIDGKKATDICWDMFKETIVSVSESLDGNENIEK